MTTPTPFRWIGLAVLAALTTLPLSAGMGEQMAANLAGVEEKIVGLAEAMPEDKFSWAPSDGVRSVSETLMHVATANHFFAMKMGGAAMPEGAQQWEKTVTTKAGCVEKLKSSFAAVRSALEGADMGKAMKLFGGKDGTTADMALIAVGHGHEHLGQMIAYARSNEIAPPWSR